MWAMGPYFCAYSAKRRWRSGRCLSWALPIRSESLGGPTKGIPMVNIYLHCRKRLVVCYYAG